MYDTSERIRRVRQRAGQMRLKRESRLLGGLSSLSAVLTVSLIWSIAAITGDGHSGMVSGLYGTMLLHEHAGGYVLAVVLSFSAAVVITVLCIRYRAKTGKHNKNENEEEQSK